MIENVLISQFNVDLNNPQQVEKLIAVLRAALPATQNENPSTPQAIQEKPKRALRKKASEPTPKNIDPVIQEEVKPVEIKEPVVEPTPEPDPKPVVVNRTLDDLRSLVSLKVGNHINVIKEKLTDLEASKVSTLDPKHFNEFYDFLNALD